MLKAILPIEFIIKHHLRVSKLCQNKYYTPNKPIMKAKLILNEIKRGKESGFGSLGVGHSVLTKTYDYIKNNNFPSILHYCEDLDDMELPEEIKDRICEILNTTSDSIIGITDQQLASEFIAGISTDFTDWLGSIEYKDKGGIYETLFIDENRYIIKTPHPDIWGIVRVRTFTIEPTHMPEELYEECGYFFRS
jgi:hypothetical protein